MVSKLEARALGLIGAGLRIQETGLRLLESLRAAWTLRDGQLSVGQSRVELSLSKVC